MSLSYPYLFCFLTFTAEKLCAPRGAKVLLCVPLSLSLLVRSVSSCKCLDLKFSFLVYHSRNWGCCRSNMLCAQEESMFLLSGFLAAFLANPWEGLQWSSEEEAFSILPKFSENLTLLSHILVSLAMHFSTDLVFLQQMGWIITLWTMFYL